MKGRKTRTRRSRYSRVAKYSIFTVLLTCVIVVGYFLIKNGVIFGKYTSPEPYIQQDYVDDPSKAITMSDSELMVTAQNTKVPVVTASPTSTSLPKIPTTDGTVQKGTKENPLVILEIVPELSQQSLSYLVSTKEEGAPFNSSLELGMEISKKQNSPYVTRGQVTFNGTKGNVNIPKDSYYTNIVNTCLNNLGAWFDNNNNGGYTIYNPDGTVFGAEKTRGEDDRTSAPWAYMGIHYTISKTFDKETQMEEATSFATDMYRRGDGGGKSIKELYESLPDFRDDSGKEIASNVLEDENNWARTVTGNEKYIETDSYTMTSPDFEDDFDKIKNGMSMKEFAEKYPSLFKKYTGANYEASEEEMKVSESELANDGKWSVVKDVKDVAGYFLYVGKEKGDYNFTSTGSAPVYVGNEKGSYIYVAELPEVPDIKFGYFLYKGAGYGDYDIKSADKVTYNKGKGSYSFVTELPQIPQTVKETVLKKGYFLYKGSGQGDFNVNPWSVSHSENNGSYDFVLDLPEDAVNRWPDDLQDWQVNNQNSTYETAEYIDKAYFPVSKINSTGWMNDVEYVKYQNIWGEGMDASEVFDSQKNTFFNNENYANLTYFSINDIKAKDWMRYVEYQNIWPDGMAEGQVTNKSQNPVFENDTYINYSYISVSKLKEGDWMKIAKPKKTITYKFTNRLDDKYVFKFQYVGLKTNDILKRMLFWYEDDVDGKGKVIKTADEKYDETYIKVIALTPSMINQMDENDTEGTLDYVERADAFYVSAYNKNADGIGSLINIYYKYLDPERETNPKTYNADNLATFYENDLEWVDCMKIIKRLSGDSSLPLMFSKQLGDMLDEGVKRDGTKTSHMYMNNKWTCNAYAGSLNNLAKLYLVTTQFDLSAIKDKEKDGIKFKSTFMNDIYNNIKKVPLNLPSDGDADKHTAKYTGFYQRSPLAGCTDVLDTVKENCYYLWNIATFIPTLDVDTEDSVFSGDNGQGFNLENFLRYGFLRSSITNQQYHDSVINGGKDYGKITGTRDPEADGQNVTIAGGEQSANTNFNPFNGGMIGALGRIWYDIMNNGKPLNPTMTFTVVDSKESRKYYQRMSDESVLIDYSQDAEYKNADNRWIKIYCELNNQDNAETSIITSVKLINPDAYDEDGNLKGNETDAEGNVIKEYREANALDLFDISDQKIGKGLLTAKEDGSKEYDNNPIDFSSSQSQYDPIAGYAVPENGKLSFVVKFKLSDWLNLNKGVKQGNTVLRIDWVSRTSRTKSGKYVPYQNPNDPKDKDDIEKSRQFAEVTIGERGLFNLQ